MRTLHSLFLHLNYVYVDALKDGCATGRGTNPRLVTYASLSKHCWLIVIKSSTHKLS